MLLDAFLARAVIVALPALVLGAVVLAPARLHAESPLPTRSADVQRAVQQFREFYLADGNAFEMRDTNEVSPDVAAAREFARTLRADGTWADVDYQSKARSSWPQAIHTARMNALAAAAGQRATSAADRTVILTAAHRAFGYWIAHDFQCPNWWYNEIGTPKAIGTLALLLGDEITPDEYRYVTGTSLARYKIRMTGQNKVWLAGNALMLGLLTGDEAGIRAASDVIWSEIIVSTKEGIQPDFSFHQHGPQQQFGNYGMAFAVDMALWARILRGTAWQLPADKREIARGYLLQGQNWVSWRGAMDISSCGRQFMPNSPRDKTANIARVMEQALVFDPSHAEAYTAFVRRHLPGAPNDLVGNRYFWRSDYMVHRRPDFAATLKMSSNRVIGAELVNSENLSGYHLGDGALYLYRSGAEYDEIFPVWDWRKLPGVTCAQVAPPPYTYSQVPTDFVGGVSDEQDGVCALDYNRDGVRAKKAWFFAGDTVIALGCDIFGTNEAGIATTINQALHRTPVQVRASGEAETFRRGSRVVQVPATVLHDGWGYKVLEGPDLHVSAVAVTGNWHRVFDNPASPLDDVKKEVFTLWFDHGKTPAGAKYAYVAAPVESRTEARVLENSAQRQMVSFGSGKVGAVLWAAGEFDVPGYGRIASDVPCILMITGSSVLVVDPTQKLATARVTLKGSPHTVQFPTEGRAGTPVALAGP